MARQVFKVPLTPAPQTFNIALGGITYQLTLMWRESDPSGWFLDFADDSNNPILQGVPLVTGADLLAQYDYMGWGGSLLVQGSPSPDDEPTFTNLGLLSHVYFVTPE